jgi:hypothetical protein
LIEFTKEIWSGLEYQVLSVNIDFKLSFNYRIDIKIRIKYEIENKLYRDWWSDINPMIERCLRIIINLVGRGTHNTYAWATQKVHIWPGWHFTSNPRTRIKPQILCFGFFGTNSPVVLDKMTTQPSDGQNPLINN